MEWEEAQRQFMGEAIDVGRASALSGEGGPFGACIVRDGVVLAKSGNRVLHANDPTAHAEVSAIRAACVAAGSHLLRGATIFSTTEPCPMCFAAIHWAQIERIVFGTSIADVHLLGFNELTISNEQMRTLGGSPVQLVCGFMEVECRALLDEWAALPRRTAY